MARQTGDDVLLGPDGLPHPAEDLSQDDDLLSWIFVDQMGALPGEKLGVHPQQVKFVGPKFDNKLVMEIVQETVMMDNIREGLARLKELPIIKEHRAAKQTDEQRKAFDKHLRRYLSIFLPGSRIEIYQTTRYKHVSGHEEMAVYATKAIPANVIIVELQGGLVPLPKEWSKEMAHGAASGSRVQYDSDASSEEDDDEPNGTTGVNGTPTRSRRVPRRSVRHARRDFSILYTTTKKEDNMFLGPARFLNHDCTPNVALHRLGSCVSFKTLRPIRIGEELLTEYAECYFGENNVECLCLTCEKNGAGGFANNPNSLAPTSLPISLEDNEDPLSGTTSRRGGTRPVSLAISQVASPATPQSLDDGDNEEGDDDDEEENQRRSQPSRRAKTQSKPLQWKFNKSRRTETENTFDTATEASDDSETDVSRCITCAVVLKTIVWRKRESSMYCPRCTRHAIAWKLPWPAHREQDLPKFPPSHLVPSSYDPPRIERNLIPSLVHPVGRTIAEVAASDIAAISQALAARGEGRGAVPDSKEERRARAFRKMIDEEEDGIERLRLAEWEAQEHREQARAAKEQQRRDAQKKREEDKKKREEGKVRGTGLWTRYTFESAEDAERRIAEKHAVRSGTRRGGRFRASSEDEEMSRLAEETVRKARDRELQDVFRSKTRNVAGSTVQSDDDPYGANTAMDEPDAESGDIEPDTADQDYGVGRSQTPEAGPSRTQQAQSSPLSVKKELAPRRRGVMVLEDTRGTQDNPIVFDDSDDDLIIVNLDADVVAMADDSDSDVVPMRSPSLNRPPTTTRNRTPNSGRKARSSTSRRSSGAGPSAAPSSSSNSTQNDPNGTRRGRGRPPGSGSRQRREREQRERQMRYEEERKRREKELEIVELPTRAAQEVFTGIVDALTSTDSADEASPPSADDDVARRDTPSSFDSDNLDLPQRATRSSSHANSPCRGDQSRTNGPGRNRTDEPGAAKGKLPDRNGHVERRDIPMDRSSQKKRKLSEGHVSGDWQDVKRARVEQPKAPNHVAEPASRHLPKWTPNASTSGGSVHGDQQVKVEGKPWQWTRNPHGFLFVDVEHQQRSGNRNGDRRPHIYPVPASSLASNVEKRERVDQIKASNAAVGSPNRSGASLPNASSLPVSSVPRPSLPYPSASKASPSTIPSSSSSQRKRSFFVSTLKLGSEAPGTGGKKRPPGA